jgi:hypothetical protein
VSFCNKLFRFNLVAFLRQGKSLDILSWLVIVSFVILLGLGLLVPVYTDEVATKLVRARFFAEEGKMLSLFPQCASGFILDTPISWYPAAAIYSILYSNLWPLGLRISGVVTAFIWLALLSYWVVLTIPARSDRVRVLGVIAAVFGLGVLPLTLVLARAEQWLILLLVAYCVFSALAEQHFQRPRIWVISLWFVAFCIVTSLFFYAHPKAIFFLPVVIFSAFCIFGFRHKLLLWLAVSFTILCATQSVLMAKSVIYCNEAPILSEMLASQTIKLTAIRESPKEFLLEAINNMTSAPSKIVRHMVFQNDYQSGWLPSGGEDKIGILAKLANFGIELVVRVTFWLAVVISPIAFISSIIKKSEGCRKYLIASLWLGLVGHLIIFKEWNFYGGALPILVALMLIVLGIILIFGNFLKNLAGNLLLASIFALSLVSSVVLVTSLSHKLFESATSTVDILFGQPLSVNTFNFSRDRDRVRALAKNCNIQGDGAKRLVVDDLTYFAFENLRQPLHLVYLYDGGFGADIGGKKIRGFLTGIESDGIIAQCTYISPAFNKIVVREGGFCCVNLNKDLNM